MFCQGCVTGPDPGAVQSAMELVGYQRSCKEIPDVYQSDLSAMKAARYSLLWGANKKEDHQRYPLFPKRLHEKAWRGLGASRKWWPRPNRWEPYK